MADETVIHPNLILKATETDLREEYIDETFWEAMAVDSALETNYEDTAPESVMVRKTNLTKLGQKYIEFGETDQLQGEGRYDDEVLEGHEEPIESKDNAVYFSAIRHGVPCPLKGLEKHYAEAFNLIQRRQKALSIWNARVAEMWHWQSFVYGCPDKVNTKHGASSPQRLHPNIFTIDATTVTQLTWNATEATWEDTVATAIDDQAAGDVVDVDAIWQMEKEADDLHIPKIKVTVGGRDNAPEPVWLWVYPRQHRVIIKKALDQYWIDADVRGPNNMVFRGDKFKFGGFLFVEAAYIPRIKATGDTTCELEEAWQYAAATNTRSDVRAEAGGVVHAILGADAMCFAEPDPLQYDFERKDYKQREGIGTYRMMGSRRNEVYDDRTSITAVRNQHSILVLTHTTEA